MVISRRTLLKTGLLASGLGAESLGAEVDQWQMPDEGASHRSTFMAYVANRSIWSARQAPAVKQELFEIARHIADFEPVNILCNLPDVVEFKHLIAHAPKNKFPINVIEQGLDDLWLRDTGPTIVKNEAGQRACIDFNFNGWGGKQRHSKDKTVASGIAKYLGLSILSTDLVLEGGCFEVDGLGTAIITESSSLNSNRNPQVSKPIFEAELNRLLGIKKVIWLKGIKGRDITDGHVDFYARFAAPGVVIVSRDNDPESFDYTVTRENIDVLGKARDANGQPLKLLVLDAPEKVETKYGMEDFAAGYVGYYLCNGGVIMQSFGDARTDKAAYGALKRTFPRRKVVQIRIDAIASGGGSIHCVTQQEPV